MYKRKDIVFGAKKGYYFNDNLIDYTYGLYGIFLFLLIFAFTLYVIYKDFECFELLILTLIVNVIVFLVTFPLVLKEIKMKKYLKLCLKDYVKLKANVKCYDAFYKHKVYVIKFIYNGKNIEYKSNIVKVTYFNKAIFKRIIGKKINILYSPSMNDILFLKKQDKN